MTHYKLIAEYHLNSLQHKQYKQGKLNALPKKQQPQDATINTMDISKLPKQSIFFYTVFIILALTGLLSPALTYSDATNIPSDTTINDDRTSDIIQNTAKVKTKTARKKVMIEDSRNLSAFFILGIVINIIMAITFAWWFSSEWRKSKK